MSDVRVRVGVIMGGSSGEREVMSATILPQRAAQRMPPHTPSPSRVRRDTSSTLTANSFSTT